MKTFKFNNISSDTYNIVVKEMPTFNLPKRDIEIVKIDGRNGNLYIDNETYNSYSITIECILMDLTKINDIKAWLTGIGTIEFSDNPGIYYDCIIKNQIPFEKYLTYLKEFPIQLELNPIGKSTDLTTETKTVTPATFTVGGNINIKPILEIKGSGTGVFNLNGKEFTVNSLTSIATIIDCDLMNTTKDGVNSNNLYIGNYPNLVVGTNNLTWTGDVSEVKIKYRAGWL